MYSPSFYREERLDWVFPLIEKHSFATLLSGPGGESISHLPFLLDRSEGSPILLSHMARANPHWQELRQLGKARVLFQGPHAYISPAWYAPRPGNVPTWNYAVVHVTGDFEVIESEATALKAMDQLVQKFETEYGTGWALPKDGAAIAGLMKNIVVFQIRNIQFEAKFKLGQKIGETDARQTIQGLRELGGENAIALAAAMEKSRKS